MGRLRLNGALSESEAGSSLVDDLPVRTRDARWSVEGEWAIVALDGGAAEEGWDGWFAHAVWRSSYVQNQWRT